MGTSIRNMQTHRALVSFMKTITSLRTRITEIPPVNALPSNMFLYGTPYEATRTYAAIRYEFEHNKSLAMTEARRALCRC